MRIALILLLGFISRFCLAATDSQSIYKFKFEYKKEVLKIEQQGPSWEDSYKKAALNCYSHFKGNRVTSHDEGLDIIDVCANPRTF